MNNKILRLTLKKQWFDMIASGVKKEEYREIKDYWTNRLVWLLNPEKFDSITDLTERLKDNAMIVERKSYLEYAFYTHVEFTNGYGKHRPQITFEFKGITIGKGNPEWGAPLEDVFIIKLGKELSRQNI
ncbi:hypothetical protein [Dysgonomonas massiliensis]|uniref:hypothetical protein n=1 Tax=Dysgonomonas massiliensis TaxID=2040292 RepID=UPI000C77CF05|nr:hypothetical protein [Dysgonomonas massiliensis]